MTLFLKMEEKLEARVKRDCLDELAEVYIRMPE